MEKAHCEQHQLFEWNCLPCAKAEIARLNAPPEPDPPKNVERGVIANKVHKKPPEKRKPPSPAKPEAKSDLVDVATAARMLGLKQSTIRDWILRGRNLPVYRLGDKSNSHRLGAKVGAIRFRREDIERFIEQSLVPARSA